MSDTMELLHEVCRANPGAMSVYFGMVRYLGEMAVIDFEEMIKQGVVGPEVWALFKNGCDESLAQFHACLMDGSAMAKLQACPDSRFYVQQ